MHEKGGLSWGRLVIHDGRAISDFRALRTRHPQRRRWFRGGRGGGTGDPQVMTLTRRSSTSGATASAACQWRCPDRPTCALHAACRNAFNHVLTILSEVLFTDQVHTPPLPPPDALRLPPLSSPAHPPTRTTACPMAPSGRRGAVAALCQQLPAVHRGGCCPAGRAVGKVEPGAPIPAAERRPHPPARRSGGGVQAGWRAGAAQLHSASHCKTGSQGV